MMMVCSGFSPLKAQVPNFPTVNMICETLPPCYKLGYKFQECRSAFNVPYCVVEGWGSPDCTTLWNCYSGNQMKNPKTQQKANLKP